MEPSLDALQNEVDTVGRVTRVHLEKSGYKTINDLVDVTKKQLMTVDTVGEKTAEDILSYVDSVSQLSVSESQKHQENRFSNEKETPTGDRLRQGLPGNEPCTLEPSLDDLQNEVDTVGRVTRVHLEKSGYKTVSDLIGVSESELTEVQTVGEKTAEDILSYIKTTTQFNGGKNKQFNTGIEKTSKLRSSSESQNIEFNKENRKSNTAESSSDLVGNLMEDLEDDL